MAQSNPNPWHTNGAFHRCSDLVSLETGNKSHGRTTKSKTKSVLPEPVSVLTFALLCLYLWVPALRNKFSPILYDYFLPPFHNWQVADLETGYPIQWEARINGRQAWLFLGTLTIYWIVTQNGFLQQWLKEVYKMEITEVKQESASTTKALLEHYGIKQSLETWHHKNLPLCSF